MKISLCTPTANRRKYIKKLIDYVYSQDYPLDNVEWLVFDDGTDKVGDILEPIPFVKYFHSKIKRPIGFKRHFLNMQVSGDIIVNLDDDDIYPKERISHAVEILQRNKDILIVGTSVCNIYFEDTKKVLVFGPYWGNHATAATFAYKKEILKLTNYNKEAVKAEEKEFLKGYRFPLIHLDVYKTILVRAHSSNTVDKKKLLKTTHGELKRSALKKYNIANIEWPEDDNEPVIL